MCSITYSSEMNDRLETGRYLELISLSSDGFLKSGDTKIVPEDQRKAASGQGEVDYFCHDEDKDRRAVRMYVYMYRLSSHALSAIGRDGNRWDNSYNKLYSFIHSFRPFL